MYHALSRMFARIAHMFAFRGPLREVWHVHHFPRRATHLNIGAELDSIEKELQDIRQSIEAVSLSRNIGGNHARIEAYPR